MEFSRDPVMQQAMHPGCFPFPYSSQEPFTPDNGLDFFLPSTEYPPWIYGPPLDQSQCYFDFNNNFRTSTFDSPMPCSTPVQITPPFSPRTIPSMPKVDQLATLPSSGEKRKRQPTLHRHTKSRKQTRSPITRARHSSTPEIVVSSSSSAPSTRTHYAVEKRYRSTLNERYATLARIVSQPETLEICRTEVPDWEIPIKLEVPESGVEKDAGKRQSKTTTLSVAIETIGLLDRACVRKAKELHELTDRLAGILHPIPESLDLSQMAQLV